MIDSNSDIKVDKTKITLEEQGGDDNITIIKDFSGLTMGYMYPIDGVLNISLNDGYMKNNLSGQVQPARQRLDVLEIYTSVYETIETFAKDNGLKLEQ